MGLPILPIFVANSDPRKSESRPPACGLCGLYKTCKSPKMPVSGKGEKKILIVGEAPGATEDKTGIPFVGDSGKLLENSLARLGIRMRTDCWITNALICRPVDNTIEDDSVVDYCRPNVVKTIRRLKPTTVILLGGIAVKSVIGWLWKWEGGITQWAGWQIPCQKINAWVCPTYHPSFILRMASQREGTILTRRFEDHLQKAIMLTKRPFKKIPNYRSQVNIILNAKEAARRIASITHSTQEGVVAFDYETDRIKPDNNGRILSVAMSTGEETIAFPWCKETKEEFGNFLLSSCKKVAHNLKFEDRWSRYVFGVGVKNWLLDGLIAAHVLDTRKGTKSLKFQAFVRLGQDVYDDEVDPYKSSKGSNLPNRLKQFPIDRLLMYNGLDALLSYKLYEVQRGEVGVA